MEGKRRSSSISRSEKCTDRRATTPIGYNTDLKKRYEKALEDFCNLGYYTQLHQDFFFLPSPWVHITVTGAFFDSNNSSRTTHVKDEYVNFHVGIITLL